MAVNGHVALVGAGPGDPELLTRRAIARLRAADLVLYDALIDERVLRYARRAQRFFVGKRAGRPTITQQAIHAVMIRAARRGRRVVRLKGGDPFVFGRGGEEALALRRAGISCEIVQGVSSAIAAPAAAGIPVTHRGLSAAILVLSGHDEHTFGKMAQGLAGRDLTIVVLMGLARARSIGWALINDGWIRGTPVAIVADATMPTQNTWRGTLDDLAADRHVGAIHPNAVATIVVGDVVAFARSAEEGLNFTTEREASTSAKASVNRSTSAKASVDRSTSAKASVDRLAERRVFRCL